jgi:hypothetical protein
VDALVTPQVFVRAETLAARLLGADVVLVSTEIGSALKRHVARFNIALE